MSRANLAAARWPGPTGSVARLAAARPLNGL
jgi:hypothetical protein